MPRYPRSFIETTFFHVIVQGIDRMYIFNKSEDIKYYIKMMYRLAEEQNISILAYCIMNNHAHILLETEKVKYLSQYMHRLNTIYGKYFNKKYNRVGYVFRDRYKAEGIDNEEHKYNCINYIYDNPVNAGICEKPEQYPYSNYKKNNVRQNKDYVFIEIEEEKKEKWRKQIDEFLKEHNISLMELRENKTKLKQLLKLAKDKYNMSFRTLEKELEVSRETLRKLYSK